MSEPVRDLAHLSHIELLTPKPAESLAYFRDLLGMGWKPMSQNRATALINPARGELQCQISIFVK